MVNKMQMKLNALCIGILIVLQVSESCSPNADCTSTETYCSSAGTCDAIPYSPYPILSGVASSSSAAFNIVMATDVQLYYTNCKQGPLDECIFHNVGGGKNGLLRAATRKQKNCIESRINDPASNVLAVFNNGDITNSGAEQQLIDYRRLFHEPVGNFSKPMIIGLGNHDYAKTIPNESERKRMINFFAWSLDQLKDANFKLRSIDYNRSGTIFNYARNQNEVHNRGSLSYSFELNGYVFVILHWSTGLPTGTYRDYFHASDAAGGYEEYFDITSPEDWLRAELANTASKPVILVPHTWRGLSKFINNEISDIIETSSVMAVLAGHDHDQWGFFTNAVYGSRVIPVFYAGSTSYQKLISIRFEAGGGGLEVTPYNTTEGAACAAVDSDNTTQSTTRILMRPYDELRVELNGKNRKLSLCNIKLHVAGGSKLLPTDTLQSSTFRSASSDKAFAKSREQCTETYIGRKHYWIARFRTGHEVSKIELEGNPKFADVLLGAKVFWKDRHIATIQSRKAYHLLLL